MYTVQVRRPILSQSVFSIFSCEPVIKKTVGLVRDLNPGPLAPKARIIPLDQQATWSVLMLANIIPCMSAVHVINVYIDYMYS